MQVDNCLTIINFVLNTFIKTLRSFINKLILIQLLNCICAAVFTLLGISCSAQGTKNYQFNNFSSDHGLPQTVFEAILQDKKGYMWFGTRQGLIKYDGYTFTNFQFEPNNKNSLPDQSVYRLCEDSLGNIWLSSGSYPLLSKYNQHSGRFTVYRHDDHNKFSLPAATVKCMLSEENGQLWIGTEAGLYYYEAALDRMINFSAISSDTLLGNSISCLLKDGSGKLWIGTGTGVNIYDPGSRKLKPFNPANKDYPANPIITSMLVDHTNCLWIGIKGKGIYWYNPYTNSSKLFSHDGNNPNSLSSDVVNSIIEDQYNDIWIGTYGGGISLYQSATANFKNYRADISNNHSLATDHVLTLCEDRSGVLWIGTNGGGLNNLSLKNKKFNVYKGWDKEYISHEPLSLYKDHSGKIYMTTFGKGVQEFNSLTGKFKAFNLILPADKLASVNFCYGAVEASNGNFYIVGFNSSFYILDKNTGKFKATLPEGYHQDTTYQNQFNCIVEDLEQRLWIGSNNGLKCYDIKRRKFYGVEQLYLGTNKLSKEGIVNLYCDHDGILWIGGSNGLELLNTSNGQLKTYKHTESNAATISNNTLNYFYDDKKGIVWIATEGGLNRFNKKSEQFISFTKKDGLPGNSVVGILPDDTGSLWLSTNNGICRFTPLADNKAVFRNYDVSDGLPGDAYYYTTSVKANDGTLYFGAPGGLVAFKPEEIEDNEFFPPVVITDFTVYNKTISPNDTTGILKLPVDETKEIILAYSQNVFSFSFSALSYIHPEKNKYAYMLEKFDRDWIYTDATRRFANYTNLDAGEYIFRVKASNHDGIWNEKGISIKLIITPPWWQTLWFKLLGILITAGVAYVIYNDRLQKTREVRRIRNKIASDLHDDLGATLSSISIMSELVNQQVKDEVPQASLLLEKIGNSSRNMIESVNDMVWAINPQNDSFENIIKRMRTFASEILAAKDIAFHFDLDKNLLQSKLKMEMRKNFYLIFKEAINNLAKYSQASNAFVMIWNKENNLKMIIRDDGEGFYPSAVTNGNGLKNMQHRAETMKAKFRLDSIPGKGTIIELEFKNE